MAKRMVSENETGELDRRELLQVLTAVKRGNFSVRLNSALVGRQRQNRRHAERYYRPDGRERRGDGAC